MRDKQESRIHPVSKMRWVCTIICRNNKALGVVPDWLEGKQVYAVDASDEPVPGIAKADYRLHYAVGLFDVGMKEMALTGVDCREKVSNFKTFGENDILLGDRAYCGKQGITYLLERNSYGTNRFHRYNRKGRKVNVLGYFKGLKVGESGEKTLYDEHGEGYKPLRFCGLRKTKEAERKGLETLQKTRR